MTITATVVADSFSPAGIRLTTMQLRYPRFIHSEFMTHRAFSRNASSSRAIPVERMIADLRRDPAMPVYWGSNQPGMQAGAELTEHEIAVAKQIWLSSMENAIHSANQLIELGLHKQIANRILEPWAHINVVVTATEWENFFNLRRHKDAQPEIKALADAMYEAMEESVPLAVVNGWHLPYTNEGDIQDAYYRNAGDETDNPHTIDHLIDMDMLKVSVARCARVSYLTHDGRKTSMEEDIALYERLVGSDPLHASPAEHQATPDEAIQSGFNLSWTRPNLHGNFQGWQQYRKMLESQERSTR